MLKKVLSTKMKDAQLPGLFQKLLKLCGPFQQWSHDPRYVIGIIAAGRIAVKALGHIKCNRFTFGKLDGVRSQSETMATNEHQPLR